MKYTIEIGGLIPKCRLMKDKTTFRKLESFEILEGDFITSDYQTAEQLAGNIEETQIDGEKVEFNSSVHILGKTYISVTPYRLNKPSQKYFSKEELHNVLKLGDDTKNNTLIIDFDGYVKLVDLYEARIESAVRYETFVAGNGYVGENWNEEQLNDLYETMLQGWYRHLRMGSDVLVDYNNGTSATVSISKIEKFLSK